MSHQAKLCIFQAVFETLKVKCECQKLIDTSITLKPKLNKWLSSSKNIKIISLSVLKRKFSIGILVFETKIANKAGI